MLINLLQLLVFFCIVDMLNCIFQQAFDDKYRIVKIKRYFKAKLLKKGCRLKSHTFVKRVYGYERHFDYIYNDENNVCIFDNCIFQAKKPMFLNFIISIDNSKVVLNFNDFIRKGSYLICEKFINEVKLSILITPYLDISMRIKNLTSKKKDIKIKIECQNIDTKFIVNVQGLLRQKTLNGCNLTKDFTLNKSNLFKFKIQLFKTPLFSTYQFNYTPKIYCGVIYDVMSRKVLTNYSRFEDVKRFCINHKISLRNVFYLELFGYENYVSFKKIIKHISKLKQFNIELLIIYKDIYFKKVSGIKYVNYYSDKLHIFNYLKKNFSFSNSIDGLICNRKEIHNRVDDKIGKENVVLLNLDNMTYDYIENCLYGIVNQSAILINTQGYYNYKIINHSLILQNDNERIVYNFSSPFKFKNNILYFYKMSAVLISKKIIKKVELYDIILKINAIKAHKKLFINFWQDTDKESKIYQDIDECIKLCPPISMIYHLNKSLYNVFNSTKRADIVSNLMSFYYLVKGNKLALVEDILIIKYKEKILQNLYQCYKKSLSSQKNNDLIILYLHSKNLINSQVFKNEIQSIIMIKNELNKRLKSILDIIESYSTFDELINKVEPTLFNYELLQDYLMEFKNGLFKFKSDKCLYNNVFRLENENRHINIWLKGNKLHTIHTDNMTMNQNLYLPYSLVGFDKTLSIYNE